MTTNSKGMLFSAPMVRALLNTKVGSWPPEPIDPSKAFKSQTRRLVTFPKWMKRDNARITEVREYPNGFFFEEGNDGGAKLAPPHPVGSQIYVKETFTPCSSFKKGEPITAITFKDGGQMYKGGEYRAPLYKYSEGAFCGIKWRPSIFLPRWASRITLQVMRVRVEKFCDITEEDAVAEGVEHDVWDQALVTKNYSGEDRWFQGWSPDLDYYIADWGALARASYKSLIESINGTDAWDKWAWAYDFKRIK